MAIESDSAAEFSMDRPLCWSDVAGVVGEQAWAKALPVSTGIPVYNSCVECNAHIERQNSLGESDSSGEVPVSADSAFSLILIQQRSLQNDSDLESFTTFAAGLKQHNPLCFPVMLYQELEVDTCIDLMRAGLFDAIQLPVTDDRWIKLLDRAHARTELLNQRRYLQNQTRTTTRTLREHRRNMQHKVDQMTEELLRTQKDLEATNQELSDHMAQLSLLYRFGRQLSSARNWDDSLRNILESLSGFVGAEGAALVLRSAAAGTYSPRQTFQWEESAWDKVLTNLHGQVENAVAEKILAPGVFCVDSAADENSGSADGDEAGSAERRRRIMVMPLEHQDLSLGYLLLLSRTPARLKAISDQFLPFLQAVQLVLAEEVASAQMLDRIREIGSFNARVLETVHSGIWVFDEMGRTIYCNGTGQLLLTGTMVDTVSELDFTFAIGRGRNNDESALQKPGESPEQMIPEMFLDARLRMDGLAGNIFPQLFNRDGEPFSGEGQIIRDNDETIPVLVQTSNMSGRGRNQNWLVMVAEDLRETRKLEEERARADRLEGLVEMSATLAHEIRNPLMGLSAQAELLADQLPENDQRKRYIDVITGEVDRINDTISRLLNFVRPYEPKRASVSLLELAADCIDLVLPKAQQNEVRLELEKSPASSDGEWFQDLDGGQIKQVVLNLMLNAVDASPASGTVILRLERSGRMALKDTARGTSQLVPGVIIEVLDSGPGFESGDTEKIFRPFFTTKSSGTGLGLSICRKIITAHGGEIRAEHVNQRTCFRVLLPQEQLVSADKRRQEVS